MNAQQQPASDTGRVGISPGSSIAPTESRSWSLSNFCKTPFGCLLNLFLMRMFQGSSDSSSDEFNLGVGVILTVLAIPGLFISLLMFEKYGTFIQFLRGAPPLDPFVAAIPDEYFFLVLSVVVTGAATLWRWDAIFLDRRDYANLVPLPVPLKTLFAANFSAVFILAGVFAIVVNAASIILFPIVVVGSQSSLTLLFRFAAGHAVEILIASVFSFFAVFAIAGALMSVLPAQLFRRVSLLVRFIIAIGLLLLLATVFTVPDLLEHSKASVIKTLVELPPVSFLGIARTVWGRGNEPFVAHMTAAALLALAATIAIATISYGLSFRRVFLRTPEVSDAGALPRLHFSLLLFPFIGKWILRSPPKRACFNFALSTLLRSEAHLQTVLAFAALGLVAAAESLNSPQGIKSLITAAHPTIEFLAVPFILSYTLIAGIRFAFEMPAELRANWIFLMWFPGDGRDTRPIARRVIHTLTTSWLVPATWVVTLRFFSPTEAVIHAAILFACNAVFVEILLSNFRKIPFTCSYPAFESHSGIVLVAYLFGFLLLTEYIPELEHWSIADPIRTLVFLPLLAAPIAGVHLYRSQLLAMDKSLIFEDAPSSTL